MKKIAIVLPYLKEDEIGIESLEKEFSELKKVDKRIYSEAQIEIITTTAIKKHRGNWEQSAPEGLSQKNGIFIRRFEIDNGYVNRMRKSSIEKSSINEYFLKCKGGPTSHKLVKYIQQNHYNYYKIICPERDSFVSYCLKDYVGNANSKETEMIAPAFNENNIAICLASDNNYVPYLSVAIKSVINQADDSKRYDFLVLSDSISNRNKGLLNDLAKKDNISLRFIEVSDILEKYNFSFRCKQLSRSAFARILLPSLLENYSKILYLDCDIVAKEDVAILFEKDIEHYLVGAIKDYFVEILRQSEVKEKNHIEFNVGLDDNQLYFNSGVLLMNLEEFRRRYFTDDMMTLASSREWMWEDQDVLNRLCRGYVKWIEPKWNMLWGLDEQLRDMMRINYEYNEAYNNPYIIHYAGGCLPTKSLFGSYENEFWNVAKQTSFYESLYDMHVKLLFDKIEFKSDINEGITQVGHRKNIKNIVKRIIERVVGSIVKPIRRKQQIYNENSKKYLECISAKLSGGIK